MAHYYRVTLTNGCERNAVIYVCMSNYQNTKAAIPRKWSQRALHTNEHMNKYEVVFMSDLCQERRETESEAEREMSLFGEVVEKRQNKS